MATSAQAPAQLLRNLAQRPPTTCYAEPIDFEQVGLTSYKGKFALLIHDLFSPEECKDLLEAAETAADNKWESALINTGNGQQELMTDIRFCGRILWDSAALVAAMEARINPFLPNNIVTLRNSAGITGAGPVKRNEAWRLSRLNERLRFLKYLPGNYFRPHCDGSYATPDMTEISFLTVHIYLNGSKSPEDIPESDSASKGKSLLGGATRFFSPGWRDERSFDVNPETGACLVFQHRGLIHSGEEVVEGIKYTLRTDIMYKRVAAK